MRTMVASLVAASFVGCAAQGDPVAVATKSDDDTSAKPAPTTDGVLLGPEVTGPWVYSNDFTLRANPNGAWAVGTRATTDGPFVPFVLSDGVLRYDARCGLVEAWSGASGGAQVWKNLGGRPCYSAADGQVSMRAGGDGGPAVIRWVAPAAGSYHIDLRFFVGDAEATRAYAHIGADALVNESTASSPSFSATRTLAAGATLEVEVDSSVGSKFESTPIALTIERALP